MNATITKIHLGYSFCQSYFDKPPYHVQIKTKLFVMLVVNSYTYKGKKSKDVYNNIVRIFYNSETFPGRRNRNCYKKVYRRC